MAAKRFGAVLLTGNTNATVMTGGDGCDSTVNVHFCNQTDHPVHVYLAYTPDSDCAVADTDFLVFHQRVEAFESHVVKGLAVQEFAQLVARSDSGGVSVVAYGFEEEID